MFCYCHLDYNTVHVPPWWRWSRLTSFYRHWCKVTDLQINYESLDFMTARLGLMDQLVGTIECSCGLTHLVPVSLFFPGIREIEHRVHGLCFGVNRWLKLSVWWLLLFSKSNHVCFRMEMGQRVENPGLNPGITNKGRCIKPWLFCLCRSVERDRNTQNTSQQYHLCIINSQWNNWVWMFSFALHLGKTKENGGQGGEQDHWKEDVLIYFFNI